VSRIALSSLAHLLCLPCAPPRRSFSLNGRVFISTGGLLGEGSYGLVHAVTEQGAPASRVFALKEMHAPLADALREVDAHRAVADPNVVPLLAHSVVEVGGGAATSAGSSPAPRRGCGAVASEDRDERACAAVLLFPLLVRGNLAGAIAGALARHHGDGGGGPVGRALSEMEALSLCGGLARGLLALHGAGLAHRDVNPRNALLPEPGGGTGAVLCDLGSAAPLALPLPTRAACGRAAEEAAARSSPAYRAPELWACDPGPPLDGAAADVWALGCTLFACAWGASPFEVAPAGGAGGPLRPVEPCHSRVLAPLAFPPPPRHVGPAFERLVAACLALEPRARATVADVAGRIEARLRELRAQGGADAAAGGGKEGAGARADS
jgi:serine/threonine protein kinase